MRGTWPTLCTVRPHDLTGPPASSASGPDHGLLGPSLHIDTITDRNVLGRVTAALLPWKEPRTAAGNTGFAYNCSTVEAHGFRLAGGIRSLSLYLFAWVYLGRAGLPALLTIRIIYEIVSK